MHSPYTLDYATSYFAAQSCAALMLTALLLYWARLGPATARLAMLLGIWTAALALAVSPFLVSLGYKPGPELLNRVLLGSAVLGVLASLLSGRVGVALVAAVGMYGMWKVDGFVTESESELCAMHLAWLGLILGLLIRKPGASAVAAEDRPSRSYLVHDVVLFGIATTFAALVCVYVMRKRDGSADEWGYTFQAAVFAKAHAFAGVPRCQKFLQSFYVFETEGRLFSQYTPGWPLFLAPFLAARVVWMGGAVAHGLLVVGVARLTRSAVRGLDAEGAPSSERLVAAAGTWGGVLAMLGTTILINAASRYSHTLSVALYAWSLEALVLVTTPGLPRASQRNWGIVLGCASALMVATRPEMAILGIGIAGVFVIELARRHVAWRGLAAAAAAFALWAAFVLVVLRLQLGTWFKTGYSLNAVIHPWNVTKYDMPEPNQWKYGLPLGTGSYSWWPCSMALGLAGLAMVRGRGMRITIALALAFAFDIPYFCWLDQGQRGFDWGYGPRYLMPLLVPMAVGGGVALAPLHVAARAREGVGRWAFERGGPLALAVFAVISGWARIVPVVWPTQSDHVRRHAGLTRALEESKLTNAIVIAQPRTTGFDVLDITTNLPIDLYPNQPVIVAFDSSPPGDAAACLRKAYPERKLYTASGVDEIRLAPY